MWFSWKALPKEIGTLRIAFTRRLLTVLLLTVWLGACAGLPEGVLIPLEADVPGTTKVPILVATTRAPSDNPGILYSGERGRTIELNEIVVSIPPDQNREIGEVQWPKKLPPDPSRDFATLTVSPVADVDAAEAWFLKHRKPNRRLLIFVHGFNNRYESAVYRFAQIAHDSRMDATPVLFTWPSRGKLLAYGYDKESTNYSRTALENVLTTAADHPEVGEITVLAHSMGTWLTLESLRQMAIRRGGIPAKIENVILAAPDLDVDVFGQQLADMGPDRPKFTVFISDDDRALNLSRRISGNVDRLGAIDINDPRYHGLLEKQGIMVLDLTALRGGDRLNHTKFAQSPEVVRLLGTRLIEGQTVTDQEIGLGEHLGAAALSVSNSVGSAAGLAVSVPISVVDPATRESLDGQANRLGQHLGNTVDVMMPGSQAPRRCDPARKKCPPTP